MSRETHMHFDSKLCRSKTVNCDLMVKLKVFRFYYVRFRLLVIPKCDFRYYKMRRVAVPATSCFPNLRPTAYRQRGKDNKSRSGI